MQTENIQDPVKTKLSTQKVAKDKFKPLFCGKDFYIQHQNEFQLILDYTESLDAKCKTTVFTIALCCLRRKTDWFGGISSPPRKSNQHIHIEFPLFQLFQQLKICWPTKLAADISLYDFLSVAKIKPLPEAALSGLFHYFAGDYNLEILNYEPTPRQVLDFQIQNKRILTFDDQPKTWIHKKYGERDTLSFILHDLIHAEHFLSDPEKRLSQIGFYKWIALILKKKHLDEVLLNTEFNKDFSYLISDMNSHLIHLLKTFRALIDQHTVDEKNTVWLDIGELFEHTNRDTHTLRDALNRINTPLFSNSDAAALLHFFQNELN